METPTKRWHASYPADIAPSSHYPLHNLAQLLVDAARRYPSRPAVEFMGKRLNYSQLLQYAYRFANALLRFDITRGDRIAIMLPNCPSGVIAYFGTLLAGAVVVKTNPLYTERELSHQLSDSGAKLIVTLDQLYARVKKVLPSTNIQTVLITSIADELPWPKSWLYPIKLKREKQYVRMEYGGNELHLPKVLAEAPDTPVMAEVNAEEELAVLQYTGGTTGLPKGVMLTHYNLLANTVQNALWCNRVDDGRERFLAALPLFHVFGLTVLLNQSVYRAGELILLPRFEAETVLKTIHKLKPTVFPGAPTMYIALLNHPKLKEYDLRSIKVCVSGAAPLPMEVQERFEAVTGARLIEGYGLTEASPVAYANPIWGKRKIGTIGIPLPDTDAKIVDSETGEELPIGEIGELVLRGPQVMKGYWNRPDETSKTIKDGWLYTGDMGVMDEEGYVAIVDRKKDLIIASGFNVYPREVEEVLYEHPAVQEVCVAGVPDDYRGETVKAYVVLKQGTFTTEAELDAHCREKLAAYKVPKLYEFRESLPKSMIGKVLRRALLEEEKEKKRK